MANQNVEQLQIEYLPVADLIPFARNSRTHSDEQVAQIAASIREFGFTNPILIDGEGGIIAGHGRLAAARKLGMDKAPTITLDGLTDAQKRAYVIADNKLALNSGWDMEMLASELQGLGDDGFDLSLIGFSSSELDEMLASQIDTTDSKDKGSGSLANRFMIPPFTVFNAREGWWQDRKRAWLALGIKSEEGRGGGNMGSEPGQYPNKKITAAPGGSIMVSGYGPNGERLTGLAAMKKTKIQKGNN